MVRWSDIRLRQAGRAFVVGSTRSGKSSLCEALVNDYHRTYPHDWLYIADPKRRFLPVYPLEDHDDSTLYRGDLFPDGYAALIQTMPDGRRRKAVSVVGTVAHRPGKPHAGQVLVLQDTDLIYETLDWLYHHSDVETPALVLCDETFDFAEAVRADKRVRRTFQEGGELGIGIVVINQRPHYVDSVFLTEADAFYIGTLNDPRDRQRMFEESQGAPRYLRDTLKQPLARFDWVYVDRWEWERSRRFTSTLKGSGNASNVA